MAVDPGGPTFSGLPEEFGNYSILGHLATGGMAEVYIARQRGLQGFEKIVVIKRVRGDLERDQVATTSFLDEARLVATLEHPNIAQVHEIGLVNGSYFFVMEYVHGADVRRLLDTSLRKSQKIPFADAVYIASHVCAGLHYAHEKVDLDGEPIGIIHRDVSPSNVLLSHDGAVKLCDFGIAKAQNRSAETQRGVLKGKFSYMSPEQIRCAALDRRSDIFSMGIVLYELTTSTKVYKADNDFDLLREIIERPVQPPSARRPNYPPELERIVMRALEKEPDARYQTAQEMQLELESFALEHKLPQSSVHIAKLMSGFFEKRLAAWTKAQRQGKRIEDYLMDTAMRRLSGELPVFLPIGSDDVEAAGDQPTIEVIAEGSARKDQTPLPAVRGSTRMPKTPAATAATPTTPEQTASIPHASPVWLIAAMIAGLAAGASTVAGRVLTKDAGNIASAALDGDMEKLASSFDASTRAAHMKADGIAAAPILRAAIGTDAQTMHDVVTNEFVLSPAKGEVIEIFQLRKGELVSLVRVPADAAPVKPLKGGETRVDVSGDHLEIVASTPISGQKTVSGAVIVTTPIDLAAVKRSLANHVAGAALVGFGTDVVLVGQAAPVNASIKLALPPGDWNSAGVSLVAMPLATADDSLAWVDPVRYGALGVAALFVLVYVVGWRRAARERARTSAY